LIKARFDTLDNSVGNTGRQKHGSIP